MEAKFEEDRLVNAVGVGYTTLAAYLGDFPRKDGNSFSVKTEDGKGFSVVNFNHENFEELLERGVISYPVEVLPLSEGGCAIADHRIPREWYDWPLSSTQQRVERMIDLKSGRRTETKVTLDGKEFILTKKGHQSLETGYIYAPWIVSEFHLTKLDSFLLTILNAVSPKLWFKYYEHLKKNRSPIKAEFNGTAEQLNAYSNKKINKDFYGTVTIDPNKQVEQ